MSKETTSRTLTVAFLLCVVCSVIVCSAAVLLRPIQADNKALDKQKNILAAAGMLPSEGSISPRQIRETFERIESRVVNLDSGEFVEAPEGFDARKAAGNPEQSRALSASEDIAGIKRRTNLAEVYLLKSDQGAVEKIILPVHGYGLWSTLYGFLALKPDANTIVGLGFYEHAETPGLGGEVDNPRWKALWRGKEVYTEQGEVGIALVKGSVEPGSPGSEHKVDSLSGATITARGVENLIKYWMGESGYKPFLNRLTDEPIGVS